MKYKNYRNSYTNEDKIYSRKNIADMSVREAFSRRPEIMAQYKEIGIPSEGELQRSPNVVWVEAYTRDDGTEVKGHYRSKPDGDLNNNLNLSQGTPTGGASLISKINDTEKIETSKVQNNILNNNQQEKNKSIESELLKKFKEKENPDELYEKIIVNTVDMQKYLKNKQKYFDKQIFMPPVSLNKNSVKSPFGMRFHPIYKKYIGHMGVDLNCSDGTEVKSTLSGTVEFAGEQRGYGNVVIINHGLIDGKEIKTKYAHLSKISVQKGTKVHYRQSIGLSGGVPGSPGAGASTGPHLHFEVLENNVPVDPMKYLKY